MLAVKWTIFLLKSPFSPNSSSDSRSRYCFKFWKYCSKFMRSSIRHILNGPWYQMAPISARILPLSQIYKESRARCVYRSSSAVKHHLRSGWIFLVHKYNPFSCYNLGLKLGPGPCLNLFNDWASDVQYNDVWYFWHVILSIVFA